jgi:hypothetical protein
MGDTQLGDDGRRGEGYFPALVRDDDSAVRAKIHDTGLGAAG